MLIERDKRYAMLGNKCEKKQLIYMFLRVNLPNFGI